MKQMKKWLKISEILIGDKNIEKISTRDLMENISFVFQETKLFPISLLDNIKICC